MASLYESLADRVQFSADFQLDAGALLSYHFAKVLLGDSELTTRLEPAAVGRLAESAVILASSTNEDHNRTALELTTLLYESTVDDYPGLRSLMRMVCTRLGNIPTIDMLDDDDSLPTSLSVESEATVREQTVRISSLSLKMTRFQMQSYRLLSEGKSLSLSAPTSAGKSFLITQFVADRLLKQDTLNALLIVPTRALIRQFTQDFVDAFVSHGIAIRGANKHTADQVQVELITSSIRDERKEFSPYNLFILTQERLQSIIHTWKPVPRFDLAIVDESQKVSDTSRGILLEDTILEIIGTGNPQSVFLSPLTSNPQFFLNLIGITAQDQAIRSSLSPVAQHIYSVSNAKGNRRELVIEKLNSDLGTFAYSVPIDESMPSPVYKRIAFAAHVLGRATNNLLFANRPVDAERMARELAEKIHVDGEVHPDVQETVDFLSETIHEDYYLNDCLRKGVGYHYGAMPDIAKFCVEDLFRSSLIKNVACTSTLLEGVNLPAKNIFIDTPRLGRESMEETSFWNLAGRAGRLMQDYSGNVICLYPEKWEKPVSELSRLYQIKSSLNKTLNSHEFIDYCIQLGPQTDTQSCEQVLNNLVIRLREKGEESVLAFLQPRVQQSDLDTVTGLIRSLAFDSSDLPLEILKKNKGIDFRLQRNFVSYLANLEDDDLLDLVPRHPFSSDSYDLLVETFRLCDQYLSLENRGERYRYFAVIAHKWIREQALREMIRDSIEYNEREGRDVDVNKVIRDLVTALNNDVRFYYVRCVQCYCDLVLAEIEDRGIGDEFWPLSADFGLPNYLELGMSNTGTIQIHNYGISRTSSIEISRYCRGRGVDAENMVSWIRNRADAVAANMSRPVRAELLRVFKTS